MHNFQLGLDIHSTSAAPFLPSLACLSVCAPDCLHEGRRPDLTSHPPPSIPSSNINPCSLSLSRSPSPSPWPYFHPSDRLCLVGVAGGAAAAAQKMALCIQMPSPVDFAKVEWGGGDWRGGEGVHYPSASVPSHPITAITVSESQKRAIVPLQVGFIFIPGDRWMP